MNKFRSLSICALLILTIWNLNPNRSFAQEVLTLQRAIELGQNESPRAEEIRSQRRGSAYDYTAFKASLYPRMAITADAPGYFQSINPITQPDGSLQFIEQEQAEVSGGLEIRQPITWTGGTLNLSTGLNRVYVYDDASESWNNFWQSTPLVVGFNQPLFQYNPYAWSLKLEPLRNEVSAKRFVEDMERLALTVTQRFFDVYIAKMNRENAAFNVGVNDSIYTISKGRFQVGKIAENDLLQTELALLNAQTSLQNAELDYQKAMRNLKLQLGIPESEPIQIDDPEQLPFINIDLEMAFRLAQENSSFLIETRLQEMQAERNLDQVEANTGVQANLTANYGLNRTADDFGNLYSDLSNRTFFTVGLEFPIFDWGAQRAEVQAAQERSKEANLRFTEDRKQYQIDVEYQVREFALQQNQLKIAAKSDTVAQRRYDLARKRYLIGKVDITNLQIAQQEKDRARLGFIQSLRNYWTAWYELRRITLFDFLDDRPITYMY
jgi:outer membrane protein TolC